MKPKIYLAGRISKHDWRSPSGMDFEHDFWSFGFPEIERDRYIFVGPNFVSCDHGCGHYPTGHGADSCLTPSGMYDPHGGNRKIREFIARHCLSAIDRAEIVFAWLEPEAYGTVAELGYAHAMKKKIFIAGPGHPIQDGTANEMWLVSSFADEHLYAETPQAALEMVLDRVSSPCESPIEQLLLDALRKTPVGSIVTPQFEIGPYRVDFALFSTGKKVAVECDGHDFHEKTKEQAQRDKKRDRFLQLKGWAVLRFTGSEIYKDADRCAAEVAAMVGNAIQ